MQLSLPFDSSLLTLILSFLFIAMAIAIKSSSEIAEKWARVTPGRTADYQQGVENPDKDWERETKASEPRYEAGVTEAIRGKRFGKGVDKAGTEKWQKNTISKGVIRWGPGVQGAQSEFQSGFEPFRNVISGLNLPQQYPKGDPRNMQRSAMVAAALHAKKVGG